MKCDCGLPLHYSSSKSRRAVEDLVAELGPTVPVHTSQGSWLVPRHFIALHGLKAIELPELAEKYGWSPA